MDIPKSVQREQNVKAIQESYLGEMCVFFLNASGSYIVDGDLDNANEAKLKDLRSKVKTLSKNIQNDEYSLDKLESLVQQMCAIYDDFSHFVFEEIKDYELDV